MPRTRRGPALVFAIALAVFCGNALWYLPYVVDDAFISLRYAWNLQDGNGLVFNPGERVEGYSNFSWVIIEAALLRAGVPVLFAWKLLGLVLGVATLACTQRLTARLEGMPGTVTWTSALATLALSFHAGFAVWSQAGLETVFFTFLLVATFLRFEMELDDASKHGARSRGGPPLSALLFGLAWLTRPEAPAYAAALAVRRIASLRSVPPCRRDLLFLAVAAAIVVPYEIFGAAYFGRLLPQTYTVKLGDASGIWTRLLDQPMLESFVLGHGVGVTILLAAALVTAVGAVIAVRRLPPMTLIGPIAVGLFFVAWVRHDWMPRERLIVPLLPFLCPAIALALRSLIVRRPPASGSPGSALPMPARIAVAAIIWTCAGQYAYVQSTAGIDSFDEHPDRRPSLPYRDRPQWLLTPRGPLLSFELPVEPLARWIVDQVPEGETVVIRKIGLPGYLGMNPLFDTVGLVTPVAARARARGNREPEAMEAVFRELRTIRPGALLLTRSEAISTVDARIEAWMRETEEMSRAYRRIEIPSGSQAWVLYVRKDLAAVDVAARRRAAAARLPGLERSRDRTTRGVELPEAR